MNVRRADMAPAITEKDKKRVRNSKMADLNNSPGREGHAIMAGTFIGEFAEGYTMGPSRYSWYSYNIERKVI